MMHSYLKFSQQSITIPTLRYEELTQQKQAVLEWLKHYLDLPKTGVTDALAAFNEDSQAGTRLARPESKRGSDLTFSTLELTQMKAILEQHAELTGRNFKLEGSLFAN